MIDTKLKYLSNMKHKGLGCGGWEMEIQFLECKNGCGDDAKFEQICYLIG